LYNSQSILGANKVPLWRNKKLTINLLQGGIMVITVSPYLPKDKQNVDAEQNDDPA